MKLVDEEIAKDASLRGENEMRMCADCLGYGRVDGQPCVYCKGAGRVLTFRALQVRKERAEKLAAAAPELYAALKSIDGIVGDAVDHKIETGRMPAIGRLLSMIQDTAANALASVDTPQDEESKQ